MVMGQEIQIFSSPNLKARRFGEGYVATYYSDFQKFPTMGIAVAVALTLLYLRRQKFRQMLNMRNGWTGKDHAFYSYPGLMYDNRHRHCMDDNWQ